MGIYFSFLKKFTKRFTPKNKDPDGLRKITAFNIKIIYAFSCGYDEMFQYTSKRIQKRFPFASIEGTQKKERDGSFEITMTKINGAEKVVHTKLDGDGPVTVYNIEVLLDIILQFLYDKKSKPRV